MTMDDQRRSVSDDMENGLDRASNAVGQAVQGLPSRRSGGLPGKESTLPLNTDSGNPENFSGAVPSDGALKATEAPSNQGEKFPGERAKDPLIGQFGADKGKSGPEDSVEGHPKTSSINGHSEKNNSSGVRPPFPSAENATGAAEPAGAGTAEAGASAGGAAAGGTAAAGGAASGATIGGTAGSAAGPLGTAAGALIGALAVPIFKFIFMTVAVIAVFLTAFMMQPSFLYDNSRAVSDRELLEDSYNTYYTHIEQEYGKDITSAMNKARGNAWELFQIAGTAANRGDTSLLFGAPAAYPHVSMNAEDQETIRNLMREFDGYDFSYDVEFLHSYETYLKAASSNINLVLSIIDMQKKNWFTSLFDGIADLITGGHYSQFTDWVGRKWEGIWNDFIQYDLYSISYGGYTTTVETIPIGEDDYEVFVTVHIEITYTYDLKDKGVGFYANKLNLDQDQIDRAAEVANYLAELFGSASDTYFGWFVEGGYHTDAVQGGSVGVNINNALTSLSDKIEGMAYDSDDTHMFPLKGYSQPNLSSAYGPRDFVADSWHTGIDFAAPTGTEILAAADGVVLFIAQMPNGFGNYIVVYHGEQNGQPVSTMYAHMAAFGSYRAGDRINAGDTVGYVGSTGLSTGPHLHFQLHVGNNVRNPVEFFDFLDYLRP